MPPLVLACCLAAAMAGSQAAPRFDARGQVSFIADALPRLDVTELRPQASLELSVRISGTWRAHFEGFGEALAADRNGRVTDAGVRVREAWVEAAGAKGDIRIGFGRLVWGRLDEIQPSDVINPIDTARFLFDGRSAARLAVGFVRARVFGGERFVAEAILVPFFRRGTFDELDEPTSPFNLVNDRILPASFVLAGPDVIREEPAATLANVSGGGRVSGTAGRTDFAVGAFRGFESFGGVVFEPELGIGPAVVGHLVERFPRFTMVSADFETVMGDWELRGEAAVFIEKSFLGLTTPGFVSGHAVDAGVGINRGTGPVSVFAAVLVQRQWSDEEPAIDRTYATIIGSVERRFGRERYLARAFGAFTPSDRARFLRGLFGWALRDNVTLEVSAAMFGGEGQTILGRFKGRDFILTRLRYSW